MVREIFSIVIVSIISVMMTYYLSARLIGREMHLKRLIVWGILIAEVIYLYAAYCISANFIRAFLNFFVLVLANKVLFKESNMKVLMTSFITFSIMFLSEIILVIFSLSVLKFDIWEIKNMCFAKVFSNILVAIIAIIIVNIPIVKVTSRSILRNVLIKKDNNLIFIIVSSIMAALMIIYGFYFDIDKNLIVVLTLLLVIFYGAITMNIFNKKNQIVNLQEQYELTIYSLGKYEKMITDLRKKNHENNNNLIAIRGLAKNSKPEVVKYIDVLINDKKADDQELLSQTKHIPAGGLQGLIYQKLLDMKELTIKFNLNISPNIESNRMAKLNMNKNKFICTIVGVFIDNSIQAVENLSQKSIGIFMYQDQEYLVIEISNNYSGIIELDKMEEEGYTTKGKGHGYGLSLVKQIVSENKDFLNSRKITGSVFSQILKIKM